MIGDSIRKFFQEESEIDWQEVCMRILFSVEQSEGVFFDPWFGLSDEFCKKVKNHYDEWWKAIGEPEHKKGMEEYRLELEKLEQKKKTLKISEFKGNKRNSSSDDHECG